MKEIKIKDDVELEDFGMADWKDTDGLLKVIDEQLKPFGLELVMADRGDDNYWVKVEEGKMRFAALVIEYQKVIGRELTENERRELREAWRQSQE